MSMRVPTGFFYHCSSGLASFADIVSCNSDSKRSFLLQWLPFSAVLVLRFLKWSLQSCCPSDNHCDLRKFWSRRSIRLTLSEWRIYSDRLVKNEAEIVLDWWFRWAFRYLVCSSVSVQIAPKSTLPTVGLLFSLISSSIVLLICLYDRTSERSFLMRLNSYLFSS